MNEKLLQPTATITASVLATLVQPGKSAPLPKDVIQKTFVMVYQQLQAAEKELMQAAAQS